MQDAVNGNAWMIDTFHLAAFAIWALTTVAGLHWWLRLRSAEFSTGQIIAVDEVPCGDGVAQRPTVAYPINVDDQHSFVPTWLSTSSSWKVGQVVRVKIVDGLPEIDNREMIASAIGTGNIVGLIAFSIGSFVEQSR